MYNEFYNLKSAPFQISCDPAFIWFGEKHREALATLKYGILDNKGFLLLTGDVGTGKTSLINALIQNLGQDVICTSVSDPNLIKLDFLNYIAAAFGMDREFSSKGTFLVHFKNFLLNAAEKNKKVLLIIDEAQLLTQEMLEEIRLLSNIEKPDAKLINIFFIGQNEFNEILNRPQNRAVLQRMTLNYNIDPLTPEEVDEYIRHRLKVAGTQERLFDRGAVQEIFLYSGGFPRRINILCDHSLLSGFVRGQRVIDAGIVKECAKELKIPAHVRNRDINEPFDPHTCHENEKNAPDDQAARNFDQHTPVAQPPASVPHPPKKRFPWGNLLILICFVVFAWYFMFPDHFFSMRSRIEQPFDNIQEIIKEQKTDEIVQPENQPIVRNPERPDTPPPPNSRTVVEKKIQGQAENQEDLKFAIVPPETNLSPELNNPLPPRPKTVVEKKIQGRAENQEDLKFITESPETESPETDASPELNTPLPPLPKDKITVRFKHNANDINEEDLEKLEAFSKPLVVHQDSKVLITGYTDSMGNSKYNLQLSQFRANIVKSFLLGLGLKSHQMQIQGRGGQNPIESNDTIWGRMMNRRVEIEVIE
ncbi:AAA family ATPase [Desulfobacter latus]|uniref:AAA family ATPase n=1 Tax=Desulfobacter latus TaxID=2292 RepID=A0A850T9U5_9BACT|nr:AAA family ATPase [Desulfobacter latus]NWH06075.1 AAA family ATPase [Desulfobacter latus]